MRINIPVALHNEFRRRSARLAWLLKITRVDGEIIAATTHNTTLTVGGVDYLPTSSFVETNLEQASGDGASNVELQGAIDDDRLTDEDFRAGLYDNAVVELSLVPWANPALGTVPQLYAVVGAIGLDGPQWKLELHGLSQLLQRPVGQLHSITCRARLGDAKCGVALGPHTVTGTLTHAPSDLTVGDTSRAEATRFFDYSRLTWTGGANDGLVVEVQRYALVDGVGVFRFVRPLPHSPSIGDTYSVYRGCDFRYATCKDVFANTLNFRGEPSMPGQDAIYGAVTS